MPASIDYAREAQRLRRLAEETTTEHLKGKLLRQVELCEAIANGEVSPAVLDAETTVPIRRS